MRKTKALFCLLVASLLPAQQATKPDTFFYHVHQPLAPVPTALTPMLVPTGSASGVTVFSVFLVNTNPSTPVTVTVSCIGTGYAFAPVVLPGVNSGGNGLSVPLPVDGLYCAGGAQWVASGTGVNGEGSGKY